MKANDRFKNLNDDFWGNVQFISDRLGYSDKKSRELLSYSKKMICNLFKNNNLEISDEMLERVMEYLEYRKNVLTNKVEPYLMNIDESKEKFNLKKEEYGGEKFQAPQPMNKQRGKKKDYNYFTCAINLLTEHTINVFNEKNSSNVICDYDPRHLTYLTKEDKTIKSTYSRRFDGAIPSVLNPSAIWEIKEYYYTTTFGSRIADGVYETRLDGYELRDTDGEKPIHYFMVDGYSTWWKQGKPYLCRIIDSLNRGLVDEVLFGKEIYDIWPQRVEQACQAILSREDNN